MSVLSRFGVTVETLDKFQDPAAGSGRVLLLDGDGPCYQATATAKKLDTAMRRFEQQVLEYMFLAKCESARVHLTPKGCARNGRHLLKHLLLKAAHGRVKLLSCRCCLVAWTITIQ